MSVARKPIQANGFQVFLILLYALIVLLGISSMLYAEDSPSLQFDLQDRGQDGDTGEQVAPWKTVKLDPDFGGQWVVAGDIDGDRQTEIVSAENFNEGDVHYTSSAAAQKLDGSVLWRWGDPAIGRKNWHHDVALQLHDWDGDGQLEVVLATKGALVELNGATGEEKRRIAIPEEATDCLVFCNLSGNIIPGSPPLKGGRGDVTSATTRPTDVLVKDRYRRIYAYDATGKLLWEVKDPGGRRTAHQPVPVDVNGDGRDEIMAGYAMLDAQGQVLWTYKSNKVDETKGHLDCMRVAQRGVKPEDFRLAITCCGANNLAMLDGNGKILWEVPGEHFESIDIGRVFPNVPGPQIIVDIDHREDGPVWIFDEKGQLLGRIVTDYSRHHALVDWDGDGNDEIVVGHNAALYSHQGKRIATLIADPAEDITKSERSLAIGDIDGDGLPDILLITPETVQIYRNPATNKPTNPIPLGTEPNFTLY
ncbi:MAG: hypothetical protein QG656_1042 [Candidatus Hydrogenedentes bacterium]|nr:hypothetical protein [Candidatus Hydrogenedentota bacterium]